MLLISSGARAETSPPPAPTVAPVVESPATPAVGVSADAPPNTNGDFRPQFACYGELGGAAVVYSANLELRPAEPFSVRLGAAVLPVSTTGLLPITVVGASTYLGRAPHHFEIGLNYAHIWLADTSDFLNPSLGYRYQLSGTGFVFRVSIGPLVAVGGGSPIPWAGLSWGFATPL